MSVSLELRALPVEERLQLVEELWNSIVEDQHSLPDQPSIVATLRARKARYEANPASGISWDEAKSHIRPKRV